MVQERLETELRQQLAAKDSEIRKLKRTVRSGQASEPTPHATSLADSVSVAIPTSARSRALYARTRPTLQNTDIHGWTRAKETPFPSSDASLCFPSPSRRPPQEDKVRLSLNDIMQLPGVMRDADGNDRENTGEILDTIKRMLERCDQL